MRQLYSGLFDDAALFPPGNSPMAVAVPAHRQLRLRVGELVGPFVVPAARLEELVDQLEHDDEPVDVSVIAAAGDLPAAAARVAAHPGLALRAVEVPVVDGAVVARHMLSMLDDVVPAHVPAALELPRTAARDEVLDALAGTRYRAKLRTGGIRAELFPAVEELAATLAGCVGRGVAFKCTAGLHHAIRHTDLTTGFDHHGFLNVLLAVDALVAGGAPQQAATWLQERDEARLVAAVRSWDEPRAGRARALFTSFGTCDVLEPVDDLVALGLLPARERTPA